MDGLRVKVARFARLQVILSLGLTIGIAGALVGPKEALASTVSEDTVAITESDTSFSQGPQDGILDSSPVETSFSANEGTGSGGLESAYATVFDSTEGVCSSSEDEDRQANNAESVKDVPEGESTQGDSVAAGSPLGVSAQAEPDVQEYPASLFILYPTPKADGTFDPSFDISEYRGRFMNYTDVRSFFYDNPNFDLIDTRDLVETMAGECRKNEYSPGLFYSFNSKLIMYNGNHNYSQLWAKENLRNKYLDLNSNSVNYGYLKAPEGWVFDGIVCCFPSYVGPVEFVMGEGDFGVEFTNGVPDNARQHISAEDKYGMNPTEMFAFVRFAKAETTISYENTSLSGISGTWRNGSAPDPKLTGGSFLPTTIQTGTNLVIKPDGYEIAGWQQVVYDEDGLPVRFDNLTINRAWDEPFIAWYGKNTVVRYPIFYENTEGLTFDATFKLSAPGQDESDAGSWSRTPSESALTVVGNDIVYSRRYPYLDVWWSSLLPKHDKYQFGGWATYTPSGQIEKIYDLCNSNQSNNLIDVFLQEDGSFRRDVTLYPVWNLSYVIFNGNGGKWGTSEERYFSLTVPVGTGAGFGFFIPDETPIREGLVFKGWNTKADGTGTHYDPYSEESPQEVMSPEFGLTSFTLFAEWEDPSAIVDPGDGPVDPGDDPVDPGDDPVDPGDDPVDPGDGPVDPDPGDGPVDPGTEGGDAEGGSSSGDSTETTSGDTPIVDPGSEKETGSITETTSGDSSSEKPESTSPKSTDEYGGTSEKTDDAPVSDDAPIADSSKMGGEVIGGETSSSAAVPAASASRAVVLEGPALTEPAPTVRSLGSSRVSSAAAAALPLLDSEGAVESKADDEATDSGSIADPDPSAVAGATSSRSASRTSEAATSSEDSEPLVPAGQAAAVAVAGGVAAVAAAFGISKILALIGIAPK